MSPVVKCAEAIHDRTIQEPALNDGFEAVLFDEVPISTSGLSNADATSEDEPFDMSVFEMIQESRWVDLSQLVVAKPNICRARLPTTNNLLLHEAIKGKAPLWFVDVIVRNNKEAVTKKGQGGYLPLHFACAHHAPADVIAFLIGEFTGSIHLVENSERMLPLHVASKHGVSEDAMMVLLSSFPEATMVKDAFGRTPMDLARNQGNTPLRTATVSYLERGDWLCSASAAARHWAELAHGKKVEELELKINGLEENAASKEDKINNLEKMMNSQKDAFHIDMEREHQIVVSLRNDLEMKEAELSSQLENIANLELLYKEKISQLEESFKTSSEEAAAKSDAERVELKELLSTVREDNAALQDETKEQAAHIDSLMKQHVESEQNLKTMADQIETLQAALSDTKSALERANTRLVRATIRNTELTTQLEIRERERNAATEKAEELRQQAEYMTSLMTSIRHLAGNGTPAPVIQTWPGILKGATRNTSRILDEAEIEQVLKPFVPVVRDETVEATHEESRVDETSICDGESVVATSRE